MLNLGDFLLSIIQTNKQVMLMEIMSPYNLKNPVNGTISSLTGFSSAL